MSSVPAIIQPDPEVYAHRGRKAHHHLPPAAPDNQPSTTSSLPSHQYPDISDADLQRFFEAPRGENFTRGLDRLQASLEERYAQYRQGALQNPAVASIIGGAADPANPTEDGVTPVDHGDHRGLTFFRDNPDHIPCSFNADAFDDPAAHIEHVRDEFSHVTNSVVIAPSDTRSVRHSYVTSAGNPSAILCYGVTPSGSSLSQNDVSSDSTSSGAPDDSSTPAGSVAVQNVPNGNNPGQQLVLFDMRKGNCYLTRCGRLSVFYFRCKNCNAGRETFYGLPGLLVETSPGSYDVNPVFSSDFFRHVFFHPSSVSPDFGASSRKSSLHTCGGLSPQEAAELTYRTLIDAEVQRNGANTTSVVVKTLFEKVQREYPGYKRQRAKAFYATQLAQKKFRFKKMLEDADDEQDERCPLLSRRLCNLPYQAGMNLSGKRFAAHQDNRCLILLDWALIERLPKRTFHRIMLDGTFFVAGSFYQCVTILMSCVDDIHGEKLLHIGGIYMLTKNSLDYEHAFSVFWDLIKPEMRLLCTHCLLQCDAEGALYSGFESALSSKNVQVSTFLCSIHCERNLFRNLKNMFGNKAAAPIRLVCWVLKNAQLMREDLTNGLLLYFYSVVARTPLFGRRLARFIKNFAMRVLRHKWGKRWHLWPLIQLQKCSGIPLSLHTNPAESIHSALNWTYVKRHGRRQLSFRKDVEIYNNFMNDNGREYMEGKFVEPWCDPEHHEANVLHMRQVIDLCDKIPIVPEHEPLPTEHFLDIMEFMLNTYKMRECKRFAAIAARRLRRERLAQLMADSHGLDAGLVAAVSNDDPIYSDDEMEDNAVDGALPDEDIRIPTDSNATFVAPVAEETDADALLTEDHYRDDADGWNLQQIPIPTASNNLDSQFRHSVSEIDLATNASGNIGASIIPSSSVCNISPPPPQRVAESVTSHGRISPRDSSGLHSDHCHISPPLCPVAAAASVTPEPRSNNEPMPSSGGAVFAEGAAITTPQSPIRQSCHGSNMTPVSVSPSMPVATSAPAIVSTSNPVQQSLSQLSDTMDDLHLDASSAQHQAAPDSNPPSLPGPSSMSNLPDVAFSQVPSASADGRVGPARFMVEALSLNCVRLNKLLQTARNDDTIRLSAEENPDVLNVTFVRNDNNNAYFEIKLMDLDIDQHTIIDKDYSTTVTMSSVDFQAAIKTLANFGDELKIAVSTSNIAFQSRGYLGSGEFVFSMASSDAKDRLSRLTIDTLSLVELTFAMRYFPIFTKAVCLSKDATLQLGVDVPLSLHYNIQNFGHIKFFLPPKVEDDD
ncbi:Oidioi.mRNA.OKI2018_I69.PAR.g8534.t1.cds [Oikopleura dioica]|uniref:DNA sliding clamp PCNA n=1 Tax=Oikopleura dioica TaxID=34765 RepID=A0ABN7RKH9_OIKDI|nr:Oidioi.mRNA.OKI2018_I69.PAR.g8534.t1.cds [Oikopleura dioica]